MNEPRSKNRKNKNLERLGVRLALKATAPVSSTDEVSTEQLISLRDGSLTPPEKLAVLEVLDRSESCYQEWLALNRYLDDESTGASAVSRPWYSNRLAWGVGAMAAGLLLALFVILNLPLPLEQVLDQSYAKARSAGIVTPNVTLPELIGGPRSAYDLTTATADSLPRRGLGAGLWAGSATLGGEVNLPYPQVLLPPGTSAARLGQAPWQDTEWAIHATLGRWLILVAAACQQPDSDQTAFWQQQVMIVDRLVAQMAEVGEPELRQPLLRQLRGSSAPIGALAGGAGPARHCVEVGRIAEQMAGFARPASY
jgi:hypothetical protein